MKKGQLIELIAVVVLSLMFVSSYLGSNNLATPITTNQTTTKTPTNLLNGIAYLSDANITGYSSTLSVNINCGNATNATTSAIAAALVNLENNNSVANFITESSTSLLVETGTMNSYNIYKIINSKLQNSSCVQFSSDANVGLPAKLKFYVHSVNQTLNANIPKSLRTQPVQINFTINTTKFLNVTVIAQIEQNESVYKMIVSPSG